MKETPLSNCEKSFVQQSIRSNQRLDGRKNDEFRPVKINFGSEWGSAHVSLGETKVLAQVSCELGQPKATRPNEGMLYINVETGPMAAIHFEAGRNSDLGVQINRTLERTLKDSRCVDLESLCVTAEDRVWILRVDLNVLNHDGNLIDCASIAALCALAHFKRPDVTVCEDEVKIHTAAEKDPIPIVLHHHPVCVSYVTFNDGEYAVADPTAIEERTSEANMIFGINSYRELCCLNLGGSTLTSMQLLLQSSSRAANRAKIIVDQLKNALAEDAKLRADGKPIGFTECLQMNKITSLAEERLALRLRHFNFQNINNDDFQMETDVKEENGENPEVVPISESSCLLNSDQTNIKWVPDSESDANEFSCGDDDEEDDVITEQKMAVATEYLNKGSNKPISKGITAEGELSKNKAPNNSDSEEETQMVL